MNKSRSFIRQSILFLTLLSVFVLAVNAQTSSVDLSFNPVPAKPAAAAGDFELQPDGKILVFNFDGARIFNGVPKNQISRLNTDGSLDNSFDCASCDFNITSVRVQSDGKIIIAGAAVGSSLYNNPRIRRLNADGTLDGSFASPFGEGNFQVTASVSVVAIQPDGKILALVKASSSGYYYETINRLNTDGSLDNSFTTIGLAGGRTTAQFSVKVILQADGKIVVGGNSRAGTTYYTFLYRYNANGTSDSTFESPTISNSTTVYNSLYDFDIQADGSIFIVGSFSSVNSVSRNSIAKILPAGNVDLSFPQTNFFQVNTAVERIKILPDGKILVKTGNLLLRFNADGTLDNTFTAPANFSEIGKFVVDAQGKILINVKVVENGSNVYKIVRLNPNGSLDSSLNVPYVNIGTVSILANQPDGKTIVGGDFTTLNNVVRNQFARVNSDGSLDDTFAPGSGFSSVPTEIVVQADGKILVGGNFTTYNGTAQAKIARINQNGSLDNGFAPIVSSGSVVNAIAVRADGKIFIGGNFTTINGQTRNGIALLNADGSLDSTFNATIGTANPGIQDIKVQADGKILVGGFFSGVNGFNRNNLVRLNADGTLDSTFNAGSINQINQIEIQADGRYVVSTGIIIRLNNNGSVDSTFQSPTFTSQQNNLFLSFILQPDGSIIVGGNFITVNSASRLNIARLKSDGTLDLLFLPNGANNQVNSVIRGNDGKILVGGSFSIIGGVFRPSIARLTVAAVTRATPFDFDGDGRADVSVFRPSTGYWYTSQNPAINYGAVQFGISTDKLVPADYDGDGKTDIAVVRDGTWYIQRSTLGFTGVTFGLGTDVPVPADYDGDGKVDIAVFRPSNGGWYIQRSNLGYLGTGFGLGTDIPVPADYDGDGKAEIAVYRPSNGFWYNSNNPATNYGGVQFGAAEDKPVPADYDGDGKIDRAVFRPSNGTWYLLQSTAGFTGIAFGFGTDLPVAADYDGDGKADVAVFRNGNWYLNRSTQGFTGIQFGTSDDKPVPNSFIR